MSNTEVENFLNSGGKAAKFEEIGDRVAGKITDARVVDQTDMESGEVLTWKDGSPRKQLVVSIQTEDVSDDDDGIRNVYAKGGNYEVADGKGTSMKSAIAEAVKAAGVKTLETGGKLQIAFTGLGKKTNRAYSAPKLYTARYEPPKQTVSEDELFS